MELEVLKAGSETLVVNLKDVKPSSTIGDIKKLIHGQRRALYPDRQALRTESKGRTLPDNVQLSTLDLRKGKILYIKDLGPQIAWKTVFLCEYFGPLVCYLITYLRPAIIYGDLSTRPMHQAVHLAAFCHTLHYAKRLLETLFVHRFSHATMPILNLFKNCSYYWGFAFIMGYYINHPLYTPAYFGKAQIYFGVAGFLLSELGNFSIHIALRNLRPAGSKERKIPMPTSNPFTQLFNFVSCPNYSYEAYAWAFFTILTQCLPAGLFAAAGFGQMALWALGKHKLYKKEFPNYPRNRKAIIPFLI